MKKQLTFLVLTLISVNLLSCKRTLNEQVGPSICASDNFAMKSALTATSSSIDFTQADSVILSAETNEAVIWTITITGKTSNAKKTFKGQSSVISVKWFGEPDSSVFFAKEACTADLSVTCKGIVSSTTLDIITPNDFSKYGILWCNFDNGTIPAEGSNTALFNFGLVDSSQTTIPLSPQKGRYLKLTGTPVSGNEWYFGYVGNKVSHLEKLSTDPSKIYVNFYYNVNGKTNTDLVLVATGGVEGESKKRISGSFAGWKLISFPLSELNVTKVSEVNTLTFSLNTLQLNKAVEANIDFFILTKDKPFSK